MTNKGFLYGLGFGILCSNVYPLIKGNLHTTAVKVIEGALSAEKTTKTFVEEVHEQALERRNERFKKATEESKDSGEMDELYKDMKFIKSQLEEMKLKLNNA